MKKKVSKVQSIKATKPSQSPESLVNADFDAVVNLIDAARSKALISANTILIELYWEIGRYISQKINNDGWGQGTVQHLAEHVLMKRGTAKGFSAQNLWRMRQIYDAYSASRKLAPLVREISWSNNLLILSRCKTEQAKAFYLETTMREKWGKRELERQIDGLLFERTLVAKPKLSPLVRELHRDADSQFKSSYLVEFLDLPPLYSEADLEGGLIQHMTKFLVELGRDFCFVGRQYPVQVGNQDFAIDLLFFNRALGALVAFELKTERFKPEFLGKLEFYLEALDRDVRKPHEQPSIGVLLCATSDSQVVEYSLSRSMSPAMVAAYETKMPDKSLLKAKLHEFYEQAIADRPTNQSVEQESTGKLSKAPSIKRPPTNKATEKPKRSTKNATKRK